MSSDPLSERIRNLIGWFDPEFSPEAQIVNGLANEVRDMENAITGTRPRIIRTVEELEALDPETVLWSQYEAYISASALIEDIAWDTEYEGDLPAVVIRDGAEVRAARKALEEA